MFLQPQILGTPTPELAVVGRRGERLGAPAYAVDPAARRQIVDALVADVVPMGREDQRGDEVWRYRVSLDGDRAAALLPEPLRREMAAWDEGDGRRDADLWLDGRGRLRRLSIFYAVEDGRGFRVDNELWDYGRPGRLDLPDDLGDPTAEGGEGTSSFSAPGVDIGAGRPSFTMSIFESEQAGGDITVDLYDRPAPGAETRRRFFRLRPAAGRPLEPGSLRLVDVGGFDRGAPLAADLEAPEVAAKCPRRQPRSGEVIVVEAVRYQDRYYVRLHLRFTVRCQPPGAAAPVSVSGEVRYHALT